MKLKFIAFILIACSFTSCIDLTEYFTINEDGSGVYEQKMDMTRALTGLSEMMEAAGGGQGSSNKKKEKVDTVIYYASIVDTVSTLSAEQKTAFKKAYAKIHLDEANNEIVMNILFPFASPKEFNIIQTAMADNKAYGSLSDIMLGALGSKNKQLAGGDGENTEDKPSTPTRDYVYTLTGTSLSRKVIEKKETDQKSEEELPEQMKELMKMNIKTVIKLPRAIKQSTGSNLTLSDNKKEVTFFKNVDLNTKFTGTDFDFSLAY